jgi:SnoaL-like domain
MLEPWPRIEKIYAAFNARFIDEVFESLTDDVEWPNGWEGGYLRGKAAVRDYWERQWKEIDPTVSPLGVALDNEGVVVVRVHQVVHDLEGNLLGDTELEHAYRTKDDLFDRMEIRELPQ